MKKNKFFNPSMLYKEFMILDIIDKNKTITQREMSDKIGVVVSMINKYLDRFENRGLILRQHLNTKNVKYILTKNGINRMRFLNIGYLNATQNLYNSAIENIDIFMKKISQKKFKKIILYGAGEVCEIFLSSINQKKIFDISIEAIIDDNVSKINKKMYGVPIISKEEINNFTHDGILISSYTNKDKMQKKLLNYGYKKNRIVNFFS